MEKILTNENSLPVLPIRDMVVFPNIVVSIFIGRQISINAIKSCDQKNILLLTQRDGNIDNPTPFDLFTVGVLCRIIQITQLSDDGYMISAEGLERVKIDAWTRTTDFLEATFTKIESILPENISKSEAHMQSVVRAFEEYAQIQPRYPAELIESLLRTQDKAKVVNLVATNLPVKIQHKQTILEELKLEAQFDMLLEHIESEKYISELEQRIRSRIKKQVEQTQKEVLREQVSAIQKELSEDGDDIGLLEKKIKDLDMTPEAREKVEAELRRMKMMNPLSAEASILRSYIECVTELPWGKYAKVNTNLKEAEAILNEHHYGLEKTKERIYEFIAMQNRMQKVQGPVLCLFGPPGVGKTSLARSVAEATGRPFVRIALGGMKDEAEIRGHRRTYIGAMPGKIIQGLRSAKFCNPLVLLDEIGNVGQDWRGDPASALLEVLDPEQNPEFRDHYLEFGFDLSSIIFIATTNHVTLQPALRDRFEIVNMPGYTSSEKFHIASNYLIKKQMKMHGLKDEEFSISGDAVKTLISDYTCEAGLRNLDRELANLSRKALRKIEMHNEEPDSTPMSIAIDENNLKEYAGVAKYRDTEIDEKNQVGVAAGLAWSEMGGSVLYIESVIMPGTGKMLITGKLGDVMQESAKAALSLIRSKANDYAIPMDFFKHNDIHVHVPEGATPKDGPSAGITIFTSILSAITKRTVRSDVAMTGELTLRGRILAIGGLKEKSLAAHRAKIKTILVPEQNERNLEDIPDEVRQSLTIRLCHNIDEVLSYSLASDPQTISQTIPDPTMQNPNTQTGVTP